MGPAKWGAWHHCWRQNQDLAPHSAQCSDPPENKESSSLAATSSRDTHYLWPEKHTALTMADTSLPRLMKGSFSGCFLANHILFYLFYYTSCSQPTMPKPKGMSRKSVAWFPSSGSPPASVSLPHPHAFPQLARSLLPHRRPS